MVKVELAWENSELHYNLHSSVKKTPLAALFISGFLLPTDVKGDIEEILRPGVSIAHPYATWTPSPESPLLVIYNFWY